MLISVCCAHGNTLHLSMWSSVSAEENPGEKCTWEHGSAKNKFTVHVKKKAAGKLQTEKDLTPFFEKKKTYLDFFPLFKDLSYMYLTFSRFFDLRHIDLLTQNRDC